MTVAGSCDQWVVAEIPGAIEKLPAGGVVGGFIATNE